MADILNAQEIIKKAAESGISYRMISKQGGPNISTLSRIATGKTRKVHPRTLFLIIKAVAQC
jgi:hypothetical protein